MAAGDADGAAQQAEAFRRLYPDQYLARFLASGIRADGRPLARARPTTVGVNAVGTADSSALVKVGNTTAMAGIKLEVMVPAEDKPNEGEVAVLVELAPLCSAETRPGRASEAAQCLTEQVASALQKANCVNLADLALDAGKAAWMVYLDIYILDADGSLLDAALLAALASLASLQLPPVSIKEDGQVRPAPAEGASDAGRQLQGKAVALQCLPVALTSGMYDGKLLSDLNAEEEKLVTSMTTAVVDSAGRIYGVHKAGGLPSTPAQLLDCIQAARLRCKEVEKLLEQALSAVPA